MTRWRHGGFVIGGAQFDLTDHQVAPNSAGSSLDEVSASVSLTWRDAGQITPDDAGLLIFPPLPNFSGLYRFEFYSLNVAADPRSTSGSRFIWLAVGTTTAN
ncbi:MAG: hypothetical protein ACRDQX_01470 [Pseudonocardiaceae bacterium]